MQETWVQSLGWEDPLEKGWATVPSANPEFHGHRPWGRKESDRSERLTFSDQHEGILHCSSDLHFSNN